MLIKKQFFITFFNYLYKYLTYDMILTYFERNKVRNSRAFN